MRQQRDRIAAGCECNGLRSFRNDMNILYILPSCGFRVPSAGLKKLIEIQPGSTKVGERFETENVIG
jgi:hypothetical protein